MKISISELTTYPSSLEPELDAYAAAGLRAVELSLEKVGRYLAGGSPDPLRERLERLGIVASGAVSFAPQGPSMLLSSGAAFDAFLDNLRPQLQLCQALGVGVLGVGADQARWMNNADWQQQAIGNLRTAAAIADDHGVRLAIEYLSLGPPIGPFLLESLADTKALVDAAYHPALGLCIDFFHHFRAGGTDGELRALDADEIANVHVTDVKERERISLEDADRALPGDGVAPVAAYRDAIAATGYDGYWTLELLDPVLWQQDVGDVSRRSAASMQAFAG